MTKCKESRTGVSRGWGNREFLFRGYRRVFFIKEKILKIDLLYISVCP
jgi:hypothetical protein